MLRFPAFLAILVAASHLVRADNMATTSHTLAKQLMMQQLFIEERTRSDGASGLKQVRHYAGGSKTYQYETHSGDTAGAMHDHDNHINTVGMGEVVAVLNGVEFRTRHNDYKLVKPHSQSDDFHATEDIPFPEVPEEVTKKGSVKEQIDEMKEWFRAFLMQDSTMRDYRKYFKPVLCYLEGFWTTDTEEIEESFESDRHHIEASSWADLHEKIRFTSYGGSKSNLENLAYLPTTVINVTDGVPVLAQWNYRILCHPIEDDLPLNRLRVVDDLSSRMMHKRTMTEHMAQKTARFQINPFDTDEWHEDKIKFGLLDKLMFQIPGVNNYGIDLRDETFGIMAYEYQGGDADSTRELNSGKYHRWYQVNEKGAQGLKVRHRGFSDPAVFMAQTTNTHIAETGYQHCGGRRNAYACKEYTQRWTYAIPLEIIYLTPLSKWNPYEIKYRGLHTTPEGESVAKGRNGGKDKKKAFDGNSDNKFYRTPVEFFTGNSISETSVGVLDNKDEVRQVEASGVKIMFDIEGVGTMRQRFPIFTVHGEYSSCWKEVNALKDIVLAPNTFEKMFYEKSAVDGTLPRIAPKLSPGMTWGMEEEPEMIPEAEPLTLEMLPNTRSTGKYPKHTHVFELNASEVEQLRDGETITVLTQEVLGHKHTLELAYVGKGPRAKLQIATCDGGTFCEHSSKVTILKGVLPPLKEMGMRALEDDSWIMEGKVL